VQQRAFTGRRSRQISAEFAGSGELTAVATDLL